MGDQLSVTDFQCQIQWLTKPAIVKSDLIDSEFRQDNEGQAQAA